VIYLTKHPWLLMAIYLLSAVGYACIGDWRRCGYWIGALILTISITV
jgi:hypothetical protein